MCSFMDVWQPDNLESMLVTSKFVQCGTRILSGHFVGERACVLVHCLILFPQSMGWFSCRNWKWIIFVFLSKERICINATCINSKYPCSCEANSAVVLSSVAVAAWTPITKKNSRVHEFVQFFEICVWLYTSCCHVQLVWRMNKFRLIYLTWRSSTIVCIIKT